ARGSGATRALSLLSPDDSLSLSACGRPGMAMESIAVAMTRIAEIRDGIVPAAPAGVFAAELQRQMEAQVPATSAPATWSRMGTSFATPLSGTRSVSGRYSPELEAFLQTHDIRNRNGRLEGTGLLVEVSGAWHGTRYLLAPAARSWEAMRAAAAADGIDL